MSSKPAAGPKQPPGRPARVRLDSLKNPHPRGIPESIRNTRPAAAVPQCTNFACVNSDVAEDDGKLVCRNCGFVLQDVQITQEITFGETSSGAAVVQGVYVGANDEGVRSSGIGNSKVAGGMDSRQVTERNGQSAISNLAAALSLTPTHKERAMQVYRLAMNINFIQGRQTRHVAAVCLYVACRRDQESKVMLIDFSDLLSINVFKLGQTYNTLVQAIGLRADGVGLYDMNPENLVHRFAHDLEFGADTTRIANEAVKILQRMNRDWITIGRRPAGVCGAAIILAARMNNYRRTVREVVYIAKVADVTIHKRLDEFKYTESSQLTVAEFRNHAHKLKETDPPAFYEQFLPKKKRRKKAPRATAEDEVSDEESSRGGSVAPGRSRSRTATPSNNQQVQTDAQAMPPPPIPIDPVLLDIPAEILSENGVSEEFTREDVGQGVANRKKRGRGKNAPLPTKTDEVVQQEKEIESHIDDLLNDPVMLASATELHQTLVAQNLATPPSTQEGTAGARAPTSDAAERDRSVTENSALPGEISQPQRSIEGGGSTVPDSEIIPPEEFANDPEVEDCLLTPSEVEIKERIWVHENGEYLRLQQAKMIKQQLAEANGTARIVIKRKRRRGRMGDMSQYGTVGPDGQVIRAQTPAEATKEMLAKRGYSKKINYSRVDYLFDTSPSSRRASTSATATGSGVSTPVVHVTSPTPPTLSAVAPQAPTVAREGQVGEAPGSPATIVEVASEEVRDETGLPMAVVEENAANDGEDEDDDDGEEDDYYPEDEAPRVEYEYDEGDGSGYDE